MKNILPHAVIFRRDSIQAIPAGDLHYKAYRGILKVTGKYQKLNPRCSGYIVL